MKRQRFPPRVLNALRESQILGIRAGSLPHRFIGIWVVVVENRVFVRSWYARARSWHQEFLNDPRGVIQIGGRKIRVRATRTRSERLKDAVDRAYAEKYHTPASRKWVRGFRRPKSKATTTELSPA